ncbi:NAD(P)/FAD-dependent oxidoreductase [Cellulosilyticum sp. I15G10I2]|uniref:NAD(P)/FAD-dependent oxidoreductase n=1 Tax=Cellulosilyticum sp. I15G10I2 TaxID=1892843 RepID=UPI0014959011|nr:FAD-dependent oxidoreductase [Cellulosilyticum sp. I15G10I2]
MKDKIIIIGNGIAALSAIKAFRSIDTLTEIHLFGEEYYYPYNRMRLSKGLLNTLEEDKILLQKKEWYAENNIWLYTGKKAVAVDIMAHKVYFQDGSYEDYTKLLVAAGADNLQLPVSGVEKQGVFTLRHLDDAKRIVMLEKESHTVLNIGGGIQGLETAWILAQAGKRVIITELQSRLMPKQLDEKASWILEKNIRKKDIEIMLNAEVHALIGEDKVEYFKLKDGPAIQCDMALYAIGLSPNTGCLKGTGVKMNRGIIVNEKMETNIDGIYAAGDVAEFDGQVYGLWQIAIEQGKTAGYNLAGKDAKYKHVVPVTTLNAFDITLFSMGMIDEKQADDFIIWDESDKNMYSKILLSKNRIVGAIVIGNTKVSPIFKTAIENNVDLGKVDYKSITLKDLTDVIKQKK